MPTSPPSPRSARSMLRRCAPTWTTGCAANRPTAATPWSSSTPEVEGARVREQAPHRRRHVRPPGGGADPRPRRGGRRRQRAARSAADPSARCPMGASNSFRLTHFRIDGGPRRHRRRDPSGSRPRLVDPTPTWGSPLVSAFAYCRRHGFFPVRTIAEPVEGVVVHRLSSMAFRFSKSTGCRNRPATTRARWSTLRSNAFTCCHPWSAQSTPLA